MASTSNPGKAWQVTVGGIGGVAAAALLIGGAIAYLTTSTRQSSLIVVTSVAIAGALARVERWHRGSERAVVSVARHVVLAAMMA